MGDVQFIDMRGFLDLVIAVLGVFYVAVSLLLASLLRPGRPSPAKRPRRLTTRGGRGQAPTPPYRTRLDGHAAGPTAAGADRGGLMPSRSRLR
jgi:hypothetical protein